MPETKSKFICMDDLIFDLNVLGTQIRNLKTYSFGYRERIRIERLLFMALKSTSQTFLSYNLTGFNQDSIAIIKKTAIDNKIPRLAELFERCYSIKLEIRKMSSSSAYIKNSALFNTSGDSKTLIILGNMIQRISQMLRTLDVPHFENLLNGR